MAIAGTNEHCDDARRNFYQDRKRLFAGLCQDFQDRLGEIIRKRRKASMALAGGTTPGPLYDALSNAPINWEKVSLTVTDERWVNPQDPASNEFLVRDPAHPPPACRCDLHSAEDQSRESVRRQPPLPKSASLRSCRSTFASSAWVPTATSRR